MTTEDAIEINHNCRHCGKKNANATPGDWLCPNCERWQNTVGCPTCGQPVDISQLPSDTVPAAAAEEDK